jgi:hypothetical protein
MELIGKSHGSQVYSLINSRALSALNKNIPNSDVPPGKLVPKIALEAHQFKLCGAATLASDSRVSASTLPWQVDPEVSVRGEGPCHQRQ